MSFLPLSRLWLHEPNAELSAAWTDLFLLNVYPYGSAFMDPSGELNGPCAAAALARYEASGYAPPELATAGAPDHAGLCLGYLAHLDGADRDDPEFLAWALDWIPVCTIAIERQPSPHPFFRSLAEETREALLARAGGGPRNPLPLPSFPAHDEEELDLSAVVRRLLAPATSGFFLSRSRLGAVALDAGMRLPFGSRYDVARALFEAAGESGRVQAVLDGLGREAASWDDRYAGLAAAHPAWRERAESWRGRLAVSRRLLSEMAGLLDTPLELEYGSREKIESGGP